MLAGPFEKVPLPSWLGEGEARSSDLLAPQRVSWPTASVVDTAQRGDAQIARADPSKSPPERTDERYREREVEARLGGGLRATALSQTSWEGTPRNGVPD